MIESKKIWFNGKIIDSTELGLPLLTHALHYGSGVFEGIRAYKTDQGPAIFRLADHLERFFYSLECLEMEIPFSKEDLKEAIRNLIKLNKVEECYIRPIAFFGEGKMGLYPKGAKINVGIALWPWGAYLGEGKPVKVKISEFIRLHPKSIYPKAKICGYYVNSIFASLEAKNSGYDEALFLDWKGDVAEGPGENLFLVKNGILYTPNSPSILAGITRDTIIKLAKDLKIKVKEKRIKPYELEEADELFFTGTATEICPISQINKTKINNGKIGKITKILKELYQSVVRGKQEKYLNWLTFVK